ncbi:T-complex protein 11-domain-containing protein [Scheffersomyces amazonensis]|uniref:T-complex protein 11-domain-containing protein n=1 Tax=Scheffersomyces amazonensis TaxID=1078765 RepID=UPI00315CB267
MNSQVNNQTDKDQQSVPSQPIIRSDHHQFRKVVFNPETPSPNDPTTTSTTTTTTTTNSTTNNDTPPPPPHQIHLHHLNLHIQLQQQQLQQQQSLQQPTSTKRNSSSSSSSMPFVADSKRVRLNPPAPSNSTTTITTTTPTTNASTIPTSSSNPTTSKRFVKRFRSRSLPIISYHQRHHHHHHPAASNVNLNLTSTSANTSASSTKIQTSTVPPLPPINLQSLKEIDLHEILKNPQLRHDILFDPQLQFRPNLDGERGKRKKSIIEKYWAEVRLECRQFFGPLPSTIRINRLPILFATLRDILLSLLPSKDRPQVTEIMDIDLLIQQLHHGSFDFVEMARWLGDVFKSHCAPMRDQWVIEMSTKFEDAYRLGSVDHLVSGLRMIFQILEAMKLDVANHQIRILRPVLIETAVDFERDYFQSLISHHKINITDSLNWFYKKAHKQVTSTTCIDDSALKPIIVSAIIDLLSCRQMATEFPSTLAFDHTRLVLLRADVRQLVCVQLCMVLYRQLVVMEKRPVSLLAPANIAKVQHEILAIVTDDNGNIKWTKNINAISLQLVKNLQQNPRNSDFKQLSSSSIEFSYNWLMKHIQPKSEVYGLMEIKIFKELLAEIMALVDKDDDPQPVTAASTTTTPSSTSASTSAATASATTVSAAASQSSSELKNIALRISTLVKFHWNVFGSYYSNHIKSQVDKLTLEEVEKRSGSDQSTSFEKSLPVDSSNHDTDSGPASASIVSTS